MKRLNKQMKRIIAALSLLLILVLASVANYAYSPLALPAVPFEFELKQGGNLKSMAHQLHQAGLLEQDWKFVWLTRSLGKSSQIKAG